ncbi:type II toxin-antitoxin system YafQ family toxin [Xenorhabdus sp. TH1]
MVEHVDNCLLLIYQRTDIELILYRVGSHADLFK